MKFSRPAEPLVARNTFRQRARMPGALPAFDEARNLLPEPVLPDELGWSALYWKVWEDYWGRLRQPEPKSRLRSIFLAPPGGEPLEMARSAFLSQPGVYAWGVLPIVEQLDNFYTRQHDDGFISRELNPESGGDFHEPFEPNSDGPNILAWIEWRHYRHTGDERRLAAAFWPLLAYHRWRRAHRTWPNGMYWATGYSSGLIDQPRIPDGRYHHRRWTWADATIQAVVSCFYLERFAGLIGEEQQAEELAEERAKLTRLINDQLWDDDSCFYHDADPRGALSPAKSLAAYYALLDPELVPKDLLGDFIQHLRDPETFKSSHRIPSLSADSDGYVPKAAAGFRGAVWPTLNFVVLKGLQLAGQFSLAHEIAVNHVAAVHQALRDSGCLWESYAPEARVPEEPARADEACLSSLTAVSALIENVIGLTVDWPLRQVTWHRYLQTSAAYGVCRFRLGEDGRADLIGDREKVTVDTDTPFTLTIRDREQNLQMAVPAGLTEIDVS